jgi:hypothetical protein
MQKASPMTRKLFFITLMNCNNPEYWNLGLRMVNLLRDEKQFLFIFFYTVI